MVFFLLLDIYIACNVQVLVQVMRDEISQSYS